MEAEFCMRGVRGLAAASEKDQAVGDEGRTQMGVQPTTRHVFSQLTSRLSSHPLLAN